MRFSTQFTSAKADEVSFPDEMNVTSEVVRDNQNRSLELFVKGDEDNIRKLAKPTDYEAKVFFKNFRKTNNGAFADVLKVEIVEK